MGYKSDQTVKWGQATYGGQSFLNGGAGGADWTKSCIQYGAFGEGGGSWNGGAGGAAETAAVLAAAATTARALGWARATSKCAPTHARLSAQGCGQAASEPQMATRGGETEPLKPYNQLSAQPRSRLAAQPRSRAGRVSPDFCGPRVSHGSQCPDTACSARKAPTRCGRVDV
jgi:hypothetical protein